MRIVSWNCNGKFREKYKEIARFPADVYVIQECEDPASVLSANYKSFAANSLWIGDNRHKGLGIFANSSLRIERLLWETEGTNYFLPCRINNSATVVGIWAMKPYTRQYLDFQNKNFCRFGKDTVILGDFNSNAKWDSSYSAGAYETFVSALNDKGIVSAYHYTRNERHGEEKTPTFYLYRQKIGHAT